METYNWQELLFKIEEEMPWVNGITSQEQYLELLGVMKVLVEDYDSNKTLINLIFSALEKYDRQAEETHALAQYVKPHTPRATFSSTLCRVEGFIEQHEGFSLFLMALGSFVTGYILF